MYGARTCGACMCGACACTYGACVCSVCMCTCGACACAVHARAVLARGRAVLACARAVLVHVRCLHVCSTCVYVYMRSIAPFQSVGRLVLVRVDQHRKSPSVRARAVIGEGDQARQACDQLEKRASRDLTAYNPEASSTCTHAPKMDPTACRAIVRRKGGLRPAYRRNARQ